MIDNKKEEVNANVNNIRTEKHFLDYVTVVLKWRKFIIINVLVVFVIAIIISLLLPKWYKATVSILPPRQADVFSALGGSASSSLRSVAGLARLGGLGQRASGPYNYMAILNSRSAMEAIIHKFNLISVYEIQDSSIEKTIKELEGNVSFEEQKDDYITIEILDKSPIRSAEMANYFVDVLNSISMRLGTKESRSNREFIEQRLQESKERLQKSEEILKNYQEKSGMMIMPEENSSISEIGSLYGLKAKKEIEYAIAKRTTTTDNPVLQQLKIELSELDRKLATIPQIGLVSLRLYRDVIIQQHIVEFLIPIYEQAKVDEQKDIPVVLVLDKAIPPEKKSRPLRAIIVAGCSIAAFIFSLMLVFIREKINSLVTSDHRQAAQLNNIRQLISPLFRSKKQ
jgi:tyrosine-protein kinase Etk/Wzc